MNRTHILVIEDDFGITDMLTMLLQAKGYDVTCVDSGLKGLRITEDNPPDLVLLDMMLPDIIGLEICVMLREITDAPIVIMSARYEALESMRTLELGASAFILKPFDSQELLALIKDQLAGTAKQNQNTMLIDSVYRKPPLKSESGVKVLLLLPRKAAFTGTLQPRIQNLLQKNFKFRINVLHDIFAEDGRMQENWNHMNTSQFLIADCTGRDPNVFYQLGIANAFGLTALLLAQNPDDIPGDLRKMPALLYEYSSEGLMQFERDLYAAINEIPGLTRADSLI